MVWEVRKTNIREMPFPVPYRFPSELPFNFAAHFLHTTGARHRETRDQTPPAG